MFVTYVLYSATFDKIYIGYTSDLEQRLLSHNVFANKGYTIKYRPWEILFTEQFASKTEAMSREKQLKSGVGREMIWNLIRRNER